MKKFETTDIEQYFQLTNNIAPIYNEEKVHQIINSPVAKARLKGKPKNLLKFTIMTTIFAVIVSAVLWWPGNNSENQKNKEQIGKTGTQTEIGFAIHDKETSGKGKLFPEKANQQNAFKNEIGSKEANQSIDANTISGINSAKLDNLDVNTISKKDEVTYSDSTEQITPTSNKHADLEKQINYSYPEQILDSTRFIELTIKELEKFGLKIGNTIAYEIIGNNFSFYFNGGYGRAEGELIPEFESKPIPSAITDLYGGFTPLVLNPIFNNDQNYNFIPLKVPFDVIKPKFYLIFWYFPNEFFFDALPERISKDLCKEYNYITAEDKSQLEKPECKYFEECKNTLAVSKFKVYPNPANNLATISFTLPEAVDGRITLVDLSGRERQILQPQTNYSKGSHRFDVDVSTVPEGIYLLTLYTNKGVQTQRVIVAR